ncbi:MAG: glycosyltransferase family 4 protein [Chloroflexota bacterium]
MQILLPTDVFPPRCGGAGWSAHALAHTLIAQGHAVSAIVPIPNQAGIQRDETLGVPCLRYGYHTLPFPFIKNYMRHERLWPQLANAIIEEATRLRGGFAHLEAPEAAYSINTQSLIIHAQHVQTAPPMILAARKLGVPSVVTVRDHWPWDYFATGLHGNVVPYEDQTWSSLATDLVSRLGPVPGAVAMTAIPYMLAHVRRRQSFLQQADAVIAVSNYIGTRLASIVDPSRIHVIPNMVNMPEITRTIATSPQQVPLDVPYLLFVGKLEHNKGAHLLINIFQKLCEQESCHFNLVIAGNGPLQPTLEMAFADMGIRTFFLNWIDHEEVLRLMAHCALLLFPSAWGEPLSRVLLEAAACGSPILAMPTGGTADIITDNLNGALEPTTACFAQRIRTLLEYTEHRRTLGQAARQTAYQRFSSERVLPQIERLYHHLLAQ